MSGNIIKCVKRRWVVIGGGVSGISAVGQLIHNGYSVTWVDPNFGVGRMGKYYQTVPANTSNGALCNALSDCPAFDVQGYIDKKRRSGESTIFALPKDGYSPLKRLVAPLQHATHILHNDKNVKSISGVVLSTRFGKDDKVWYTDISTTDSALLTLCYEHECILTLHFLPAALCL
jgi:hypothetical protein